MFYHIGTREEVLGALQTDPATGLSTAEAEKRLAAHGPNKLREKKKKTKDQGMFKRARFFQQKLKVKQDHQLFRV